MILLHSILSLLSFLHPLIPNVWMSSSISSTHLFLGLPLILLPVGFHSNTLLGILFSSIRITCPNQAILLLFMNLTVSAFPMSTAYTSQMNNRYGQLFSLGVWGGVVVKGLCYSQMVPGSISSGVTGFFSDILLPTVPWLWGRLSPKWKWVPGVLGVKAAGAWGWPHHLHVLNVMEIWEPKLPGILWATLGL